MNNFLCRWGISSSTLFILFPPFERSNYDRREGGWSSSASLSFKGRTKSSLRGVAISISLSLRERPQLLMFRFAEILISSRSTFSRCPYVHSITPISGAHMQSPDAENLCFCQHMDLYLFNTIVSLGS
ncbi:hypothetical protein KP509_03G051000 [Ceratopteris richardii]|uniref:Uncharacterized protein n=1 Tax=Ceratopteris richardii TaxID=49495 RepID=A0A8T2V3Z5_CERRI|nr:hypothetical protein KP509_03G051000 [Ceratopteris richardii]